MLGSARVIICAIIALAGCNIGEPTTLEKKEPAGDRVQLDAGVVYSDATVPDAMAPDAAPPSPDAGAPDAAPPPETCVCPTQRACEQPETDRPLFSPADDRFLGQLLNLIACATDRIQLAIYDTDLDCAVDALLDRLAANPNLSLDLVIDDDRCPRRTDGTLSCALAALDADPRVTIVDDERSRYMHHKFAVVDGAFVWTGSGNLTERSLCIDANDAMVIEEAAIVAAYQAEFDRLFEEREFGPRTPVPPVEAGPYRVYFGPESPLSSPPSWYRAIRSAIEGATATLDLMVFAWTRTDLADAIIAARDRGVAVRAVVSARYLSEEPAQRLIAAGIPIKVASVHSKILIVDGTLVITGTPNWSNNAWANNEASLFVSDPGMAAEYTARFDEVFAAAR